MRSSDAMVESRAFLEIVFLVTGDAHITDGLAYYAATGDGDLFDRACC
jgi:hypothetical protein